MPEQIVRHVIHAATLFPTASIHASGLAADVGQSMIVTAWNVAIAGGGLVGGYLLETPVGRRVAVEPVFASAALSGQRGSGETAWVPVQQEKASLRNHPT